MTDSEHHTIVFWDMKNNTKNFKYVKNLIGVTSNGAFCILTASVSENKYILILCNSIGSPVDNRLVNIKPEFLTMNDTNAIIASQHYVYVWQFRYQKSDFSTRYGNKINTDLLNKNTMKETAFFIEDNPDLKSFYSIDTFKPSQSTKDFITAIYCNDKALIITCETGRGFVFTLPLVNNADKYYFGSKIIKVGLSPDAKYAWGVDEVYYLNLWDLTKEPAKGKVASNLKGEKIDFEKTDVWSVIWSSDDNTSFAFIQKNQLSIYKNFECEEVLTCTGYLAEFSNLSLNTIMLEDLLIKPSVDSKHEVEEISIIFETRILRDLREMIENNLPIEDLYGFVEKHNHEKLWQLLIEHAMLKLDFQIAEKCLVKRQDFIGLALLKRIKTIEDNDFKKAEIYQHFFKYDKAEEVYLAKDRKDLIIDMRIKLGHWERVLKLISESEIIEEDKIKIASNNLALQFIEKKEYEKAEVLLLKTGNREDLINVWLITEKFNKAAEYINHLPEESEFLLYMGEKFELYNLTQEAVKCYIRYGDIKRAFDTCVLTNQWDLAVEIAEQNNLFQVESVVQTFSKVLIEKNKKMDLVEFYRKAHKHTEAAKILIKIAEELKEINTSPLILKKIYVLAALEMESFNTRYMDAQITNTLTTVNPNLGGTTQTKTLDTLITSDLSNLGDKSLNNPWKGAEAFHYYIICQSQIYNKEYASSLKTALRLVQFEKEIGSKESLWMSAFYIAIAFLFGLWIWSALGLQSFAEYMTGFLVEKSLALDNIFLISLIFSSLSIPLKYQPRVIFWGIIAVIILRGIMITLGAQLINEFSCILYAFAAFMIFTGIKMLFMNQKKIDINDNTILKWLNKNFRITKEVHDNSFLIRKIDPITRKSYIFITPLLLALILIEFTDIMFAVDSIPAIFTITKDPYIIYTSNIFAILGLRALYFALASIIARFHYLKFSLAMVLIFIGSKIFISHFMGIEKFPPLISLTVTFGLLFFGCMYSLYKSKTRDKVDKVI